MSALSASRPFVMDGPSQVIGVGEAVGCMSPLVGDGIMPGLGDKTMAQTQTCASGHDS